MINLILKSQAFTLVGDGGGYDGHDSDGYELGVPDCRSVGAKPLRETLMGETKVMAAEIYGWHVSSASSKQPTVSDTFAEFFGE